MQKNFCSLFFLILPSVISVSANAFSLRDAPSYLGSEFEPFFYSDICDEYPIESRKSTICKSYPEKNVALVPTLPLAKNLKPDTLYLVTEDSTIPIEAPYALPRGAGILPSPRKNENLKLIPYGSGTDDDCALCVMKFAEGTKVAGLELNLTKSSWFPTPGKGAVKAIFYGSTTESEFSESVVWGRGDFVDIVYQLHTVSEGKMQSYHRLTLYAEGSQNLLRVENTSSTVAVVPDIYTWHVDIVNSIGTLSGIIPSSGTEQAGFVINNLVATILSSSVLYNPLDDSKTFPRYGLLAIDTPALYIYRSSHKVTDKSFISDQDVEEVYRNKRQSTMYVYSDGNSYLEPGSHYLNELSDPSKLIYYLGRNLEYEGEDVDNSYQSISRLTRNGGFFLGNALQLPAACPVEPDDYNENDPFPLANGLEITEGPANATVKNFYEFCTTSARSAACKSSTKDRLIDGSIGFGVGVVVVSIPWFIMTACLCRKLRGRLDYVELTGQVDH